VDETEKSKESQSSTIADWFYTIVILIVLGAICIYLLSTVHHFKIAAKAGEVARKNGGRFVAAERSETIGALKNWVRTSGHQATWRLLQSFFPPVPTTLELTGTNAIAASHLKTMLAPAFLDTLVLTDEIPPDSWNTIASAGRIQKVEFHYEVTSETLKELRAFPRLHSLSISWAKLGEEELELIQSLSQIRELKLSGTKFDPSLSRYIGTMHWLTALDIHDTSMSDAYMTNLAGLTNLREFTIGTNISPAGLRLIGR
tara:strand:- start:861 stop:1634 length:774 start_codon:yes stop_codon:yes gene_type:complete